MVVKVLICCVVFISEATLPTTVLNISIDGELSLEVNVRTTTLLYMYSYDCIFVS